MSSHSNSFRLRHKRVREPPKSRIVCEGVYWGLVRVTDGRSYADGWTTPLATSKSNSIPFGRERKDHFRGEVEWKNFLALSPSPPAAAPLFLLIVSDDLLSRGERAAVPIFGVVAYVSTEPRKKVGTWLRDIASWPCLAFLPDPAWL